MHVRIDLPLERDGSALRAFVTRAAELVTRHGGSLSGEHGDGRARSELLSLMYSPQALALFRGFKHLLDPDDLLNPGVVVDPRPLDADLRRPQALPVLAAGGFAFADDGGDFTAAVHRCVGVGKCRADNSPSGGFMCPSYLATRDETHGTRGRARVLQELTAGGFGADRARWSAPEVEAALDLCLSCKACASDCPAEVDLARYKSEVLYRAPPAPAASGAALPAGLAAPLGAAGLAGAAAGQRAAARGPGRPGCCCGPAAWTRGDRCRSSPRGRSTGRSGGRRRWPRAAPGAAVGGHLR